MGINYGRKFFKKLVIFRPHNVYGPDMGNEHVVPEFIKKISKLKKSRFLIKELVMSLGLLYILMIS